MIRRLGLLLGLLLAVSFTAAGAQPADDALRITGVSTDGYPTVSLHITAPARVVGEELDASRVQVLENGEARDVTVTRVSTEELAAEQLDVVLVVDTSGSMLADDAIGAARTAATEFVQQMPAGTSFAVMAFSSTPTLVTDYTTDPAQASAAIAGLQAGGETALYDAAADAAVLAARGPGSRQAVVMLSDGGDTTSERTREEAMGALAASPAVLYAIELITPDSDGAALEALAGAAGGQVISTPDVAALQDLFTAVAADLVSSYVVSYESAAHGPADLTVILAGTDGPVELSRAVTLPLPGAMPAEAAPAPVPTTLPTPGLLGEPWVVPAAAGIIFAGLSVLLAVLLLPTAAPTQLARARHAGSGSGRLTDLVAGLSGLFERRLGRGDAGRSLNRTLERGGLQVRPGEYLTYTLGAAVLAGLLGLTTGSTAVAVLLAGGVVVGAWMFLRVKVSRRQGAFADQLGDTLQLLAGNLRAGHGLLQAIGAVAEDAESPTADEFHRLVAETRLGRDVIEALDKMQDRVQSEDFEWVVQAIAIHRDVGGDLAQVLDEVSGTIRERNQIRRQIKALSAEGRLSGAILIAMPFVAAAGLFLISPDYVAELFQHPVGLAMLAGGAVLMTVGMLWIRRLVRIVF